jgi:hypothetical protein
MPTKVDDKALKQFRDKLKGLSQGGMETFCIASVKELAGRLLQKVIPLTPVGQYSKSSGKQGGTLRRGWKVGDVSKEGSNYKIEIINPTKYADYVEYGHRTRNHIGWVEGRFMLTISEHELSLGASSVLEKRLEQFIRGVLNDK